MITKVIQVGDKIELVKKASKVEGDEIKDDGSYIFSIHEEEGESVIEKIMDVKEYEKVTEAYLKMQG